MYIYNICQYLSYVYILKYVFLCREKDLYKYTLCNYCVYFWFFVHSVRTCVKCPPCIRKQVFTMRIVVFRSPFNDYHRIDVWRIFNLHMFHKKSTAFHVGKYTIPFVPWIRHGITTITYPPLSSSTKGCTGCNLRPKPGVLSKSDPPPPPQKKKAKQNCKYVLASICFVQIL